MRNLGVFPRAGAGAAHSACRRFRAELRQALSDAMRGARTSEERGMLGLVADHLADTRTWSEAIRLERELSRRDPGAAEDIVRSLSRVTTAAAHTWPASDALLAWAELAPTALLDRLSERLSSP